VKHGPRQQQLTHRSKDGPNPRRAPRRDQGATNVTSVVFPDSGHWIYEEHPAESTKLLLGFLG
jgi:pimeloyl-ACP methyl ester carboxylesterase